MRIVSLSGYNTTIRQGTKNSCFSDFDRYIAEVGAVLVKDKGSGKRVGIPLIEGLPQKLTTEFLVPTGEPFILDIQSINGLHPGVYSYCRKRLVFTPTDG